MAYVAAKIKWATLLKDCGTGAGGFKPGNSCASGGSEKQGVTSLERDAVVDYTTSEFVDINGALRSGKISRSMQNKIDKIDSFLRNSPKRPGATLRSFDIPEGRKRDFVEKYREGSVVVDDAYMSTRKKPDALDSLAFKQRLTGGKVFLRVEGRSGVDVSKISKNPGESEVLYPRGSRFRVRKMVETNDGGIIAEIVEI